MLTGLEFLNNQLQLVHCNINPDNILVTDKGQWVIGGSAFVHQI